MYKRQGLYSPTVEAPKDDDLLGDVGPAPNATPDLPDLPAEVPSQGATLAQAMAAETPDLPDFNDEPPVASSAITPPPQAAVATPDLPDLPGDEPVAAKGPEPDAPAPTAIEAPATEPAAAPQVVETASPKPVQSQRIWPWPKGEAWTPTQVYQEVVSAMEHVKHGRMEAAATTLDHLGPHLEDHLDMLLHVSVLMQHLGRHEHMKWTLDMAAYVHPTDPHVQQARAQLLI